MECLSSGPIPPASTCHKTHRHTTVSTHYSTQTHTCDTHHVTHISCHHTTASTHCSTHTHSCYAHCMSSHNCINTRQYTYLLQTPHVAHILCHHTTASTHCSTQTHTCHTHDVTQMHQHHFSTHTHCCYTHTHVITQMPQHTSVHIAVTHVITQMHQHTAVHIHIAVTLTVCHNTNASTHCSTHTHTCHTHHMSSHHCSTHTRSYYTLLMSSHNCINTLQYTSTYLLHTKALQITAHLHFFPSFLLGEGSATANFQKPPPFFLFFSTSPRKKKCLAESRMLNLLIFSEIQLTSLHDRRKKTHSLRILMVLVLDGPIRESKIKMQGLQTHRRNHTCQSQIFKGNKEPLLIKTLLLHSLIPPHFAASPFNTKSVLLPCL